MGLQGFVPSFGLLLSVNFPTGLSITEACAAEMDFKARVRHL